MIKFAFDASGKYETPTMVLCNPNRKEQMTIANITQFKYKPRLRGLSEISFTINSHYQDKFSERKVKNPAYELIVKNRHIAISTDFEDDSSPKEWFIIKSVDESSTSGKFSKKDVVCYSYESSFSKRNADFVDGTYKFYDYTDPSGTLLQKIVDIQKPWKVGNVDAALLTRYRTFTDINNRLYDFMINDVEEAYDCLFVFDNDHRIIHAYDRSDFVNSTNIILSYDNLLKSVSVDTDKKEIITALSVVGGGDVDIHDVNPIGDNYIYNFDYHKTTEWIEQPLIDAIDNWEKKVQSNRQAFSDYLTQLKTRKTELIMLQSQLVDLENELNAIDLVRASQLTTEQGVLASTTNQYNAKLTQVNNKKKEINTKNSQIDTVNTTLEGIVQQCKMSANFSEHQLIDLDQIIYQDEYSNENYITTDQMTETQKQEVAEQLYQKGLQEIELASKPQLYFDLDAMNFLFIEKFSSFTNELKLGCSVNVEMKEDVWSYPTLLEMEINFSDPTDFKMIFGTRLNMKPNNRIISDALKESGSVSTKVGLNSAIWDIPVKSGLVDEVSQYMSNSLNLANQQIINSANQNIIMGDFGIRVRKNTDGTNYDPHQIWITNGMIGFTDNNWQTSRGAMGIINGKMAVNAEVIAGILLAGNSLTISNEAGTFKVDNQVNITDLNLVLTKGSNKIILNANEGMRFLRGSTETMSLNLTNGTAKFNGELIASSGTIAGWQITSDRLRNTANGDYIGSNGYGKLSLFSWTPNNATFDGDIYAKNLNKNGVNGNHINSCWRTTQ